MQCTSEYCSTASGIYMITSSANGKRYVGSAVVLKRRRDAHINTLKRGVHKNPHLQAAWNFHGAPAFTFKVLFECPVEHLIECEQLILDMLQPEYNAHKIAASAFGHRHTEEYKKRMSEMMKGRKMDPEVVARVAAKNRGRKRSPEHIAAVVAANTGRKRSDESKARMSAAQMGKHSAPKSEEHKAKIAAAHLGRRRPPEVGQKIAAKARGRVRSEEAKAKQSAALTGRAKPEGFAEAVKARWADPVWKAAMLASRAAKKKSM